jgi:hypothetical protein
MVSAAVACLPTAVSLLLLEVLFMQISWGELSTHLAPQALFTHSSPVREPLLLAFPFPSTGKGDTAPAFSGLRVYLQFMWEAGLPPSPVEFSSHHHFHKLSCSWLLGGASAPASRHVCLQFTWEVGLPSSPVEFSSLLHSHKLPRSWLLGTRLRSCQSLSCLPSLFIYSPGKGSLPPIFGAQCAPPSFPPVFIVLVAYYSVSLFSPGGGKSVQGAMLLWPRLVCGSTAIPWNSPGPRLPKPSGHRRLAARGPSWFLHLMWSRDSLCRLEVWRDQSYASSQWLCLQSVSLVSLQDFTIGGSLSASSL